jgi:proteic killer suppression protein
VIAGFADKNTERFAAGNRVKQFDGIAFAARLKLDRLESAMALRDLAALPGNRFEALQGQRRGQYRIRINDQWRICFTWEKGTNGPSDVEIVDYH